MIAGALVLGVIGIVAGVLLLSFLLSWPFMMAWNYIVPHEFGLHALTWLQAWSLSFVSATLFKSSSVSK